MFGHAHKVITGLSASLALLVLGSLTRPTSALLYCSDISGCSGQAFCGDKGGYLGNCKILCSDGATLTCVNGGS
jgi:hypothetical protein